MAMSFMMARILAHDQATAASIEVAADHLPEFATIGACSRQNAARSACAIRALNETHRRQPFRSLASMSRHELILNTLALLALISLGIVWPLDSMPVR
jgi:hypothetical protein